MNSDKDKRWVHKLLETIHRWKFPEDKITTYKVLYILCCAIVFQIDPIDGNINPPDESFEVKMFTYRMDSANTYKHKVFERDIQNFY